MIRHCVAALLFPNLFTLVLMRWLWSGTLGYLGLEPRSRRPNTHEPIPLRTGRHRDIRANAAKCDKACLIFHPTKASIPILSRILVTFQIGFSFSKTWSRNCDKKFLTISQLCIPAARGRKLSFVDTTIHRLDDFVDTTIHRPYDSSTN